MMEERRAPVPTPIILLYRSVDYHGGDEIDDPLVYFTKEHSTLLGSFNIEGRYGADHAYVSFSGKGATVKYDPASMLPAGPLSLVEKLTLRFEEALARSYRGETDVRVDLRFCTGQEESRNAKHDNLRPGYRSERGLLP